VRFIVTGTDAQQRSTVVGEDTIEVGAGAGSTPLWSTQTSPPAVDRPSVDPAYTPVAVAGSTSWRLWELAPGAEIGLHRTNTLDYDTIVHGSGVLVLETAEVELGPGDNVVIPDVLHGWRAGPDGLAASIVLIGLEPC
jgi:quercetin dioxygenase-like cupin family protein